MGATLAIPMRPRLATWLFLAGTLSLAGSSLAESAPADPETLRNAADEFEAGRRAYKARDYETAAVHFENADRFVPNADTLKSAIRARKEAKQPDRAATLAALALARYSKHKSLRSYAESIVSAHEKELHKIEVRCEPACSIAVDSRITPYEQVTNAVIYVEPGDHSVVAGWSGNRTQASEVDAMAGSTSLIEMTAPPEPPAAAVAEADSEKENAETAQVATTPGRAESRPGVLPREVFWAGAGLTAVLGGVTVWSGLDTQANPGPDKVRTDCAGLGSSCATYQDGLAKQRRTNVLLVATGAVGVATAVIGLFATDWGTDEAEASGIGRTLAPALGLGDGVTVGAVGRF